MQSKRDGLVPIGEMLSGLPALAQPDAKPQALHHFTLSDQVNQLVEASEADPDLGFMARLMALCSLPRLLLAWISTEAVRTQNRELILGRSKGKIFDKGGLFLSYYPQVAMLGRMLGFPKRRSKFRPFSA